MTRTLALGAIAVTQLLGIAACTKPVPTRQIGSCWDVAALQPGPVKGEGLFINALPHGLSLESPDCFSGVGVKGYKLSKSASAELEKQYRSQRLTITASNLRFSFHGNIVRASKSNIVVIEQIANLRPVETPAWLANELARPVH